MILYMPQISITWIVILFLLLYFVWIIFMSFNSKEVYIKVCIIFGAMLTSILVVLIFLSFLIFQISDFIDFVKEDYSIVQGYVTNFEKSKEDGITSTFESFEVNGVKFEYKDNVIRSGYRKTMGNGGVIKGNGQYLKIGYINQGDYNAIIFIEESPFSENNNNNNNAHTMLNRVIIKVSLLLSIGIFIFVIYKYLKRKRIFVDYNYSFIDSKKVDEDVIEIVCTLRVNNMYEIPHKIKLFSKYKSKKILGKAIKVKGIDLASLEDSFIVESGSNKIKVAFSFGCYERYIISEWVSKINVKIVG